jgi:hypothetical protein
MVLAQIGLELDYYAEQLNRRTADPSLTLSNPLYRGETRPQPHGHL